MEPEIHSTIDLARLLLAGERDGAVPRTFEKLDTHLTRRLGAGGYHALLKRAVILAAVEFPWLASVHVTDKGELDGLGLLSQVQTADEAAEGAAAVLASLIGLLETFIGQTLCRRMLRAIWPETVSLAGTERSQGDH